MSVAYQIVVCAGLAPDPLQTLEPAPGPSLKNEMVLPAVLDPWAAHALYEAAHLAKTQPGSKVYLVALGPKAKLQQVMMSVAQKLPFDLIVVDGPMSGFSDATETAEALTPAVEGIAALDRSRLLLFGGWESATRGAGATMQILGERLGIMDQFLAVDELRVEADGKLRVWERIEGGRHQISVCDGPPAVLAWATGKLPEPPNNPQTGMANMRGILPALQKSKPAPPLGGGIEFRAVASPSQQRQTRVVKDVSPEEIAREIAAWIAG